MRLHGGGVFQLHPRTLELGVFLRGFNNPWGHAFDPYGQSLLTDAGSSRGVSLGLPGATFAGCPDLRRSLPSVSPGTSPELCGLVSIYSQHFPDDWQGNLVACDFRSHRVVRLALRENGSGFVTRPLSDLLRSTNETFRPVDATLGPDGALYIADWANPIIEHGEVGFRDPRRDHTHGRIWRVTARGRPLLPKPSLTTASNPQLLDQLLSPNAFNRDQARRLLIERGAKVVADLTEWTGRQTSEPALLAALWMHQALDIVEPALLQKTLSAKEGRIRAAAVRVAGLWPNRLTNTLDLLAPRLNDEHPRVRLAALRALGKVPSARAADLALSALDKPLDQFQEYALWLTVNDLAKPWTDGVLSGDLQYRGRERQLEYALKALPPALATLIRTNLPPTAKPPADHRSRRRD